MSCALLPNGQGICLASAKLQPVLLAAQHASTMVALQVYIACMLVAGSNRQACFSSSFPS